MGKDFEKINKKKIYNNKNKKKIFLFLFFN